MDVKCTHEECGKRGTGLCTELCPHRIRTAPCPFAAEGATWHGRTAEEDLVTAGA
jgi:hypothetical protein